MFKKSDLGKVEAKSIISLKYHKAISKDFTHENI